MCQSLGSSIKSIRNTAVDLPPDERLPAIGQRAQKVRPVRQAMAVGQIRRPNGAQTINYGRLDKRRSWITFNWIISFSISELFSCSSRPSAGRPNMLRFCNLNKINSSFSLFIYMLITSSLINTSTVGKFALALRFFISAFWPAGSTERTASHSTIAHFRDNSL